MTDSPDLLADPTLAAVDGAIEDRYNAEAPRPYLGMSSIGQECSRRLWYQYRLVSHTRFTASTHKKFQDGHMGEALQAKRLQMVKGVTLHTHDEKGEQFGFNDIGGHLSGHIDGAIVGLLQDPKTWHVWEHKQVNDKKFAELDKLKAKHGEKEALKAWDSVYYAQAIAYMHYSGMTRHYLTVSTPGGRDTISCRTEESPAVAKVLVQKAIRIIEAKEPLERISDDPESYLCRFCDHNKVCHGEVNPRANCRTCAYSAPITDGEGARWVCTLHGNYLSEKEQLAGCGSHLYIPALLQFAEPVDSGEGFVMYARKDNGRFFANAGEDGRELPGVSDAMECSVYSSKEIEACDPKLVADVGVDNFKSVLDAQVVA